MDCSSSSLGKAGLVSALRKVPVYGMFIQQLSHPSVPELAAHVRLDVHYGTVIVLHTVQPLPDNCGHIFAVDSSQHAQPHSSSEAINNYQQVRVTIVVPADVTNEHAIQLY